MVPEGEFPPGRQVWQDTEVIVPEGAPAAWRNVITGESVAGDGAVSLGEILSGFPVALLTGEGKGDYGPPA
jgi:(1->4)-alpha-D-glucan 1-alpha-D-glucosylmutase